MELKIITTFYLIDEFFEEISFKTKNARARLSHSEVALVGIYAAYMHSGNLEKARKILIENKYIKPITKGGLNKRLHNIPSFIWNMILKIFYKVQSKLTIVDSFPVPVMKSVRIWKAKKYVGDEYKGYCASKKEWFYGVRVHMITDETGKPIEFTIRPGNEHDMKVLKKMSLNLKGGTILLGDAAYTNYAFEDYLLKEKNITLFSNRRKNAKKPPLIKDKSLYRKRKRIETTFSSILSLTSRTIHSVTKKGFELKLSLFICAYACFYF